MVHVHTESLTPSRTFMASYKLALIIRDTSNETQFLLPKQNPPPKFGDDEYDSFVDSDLWDLPSTTLTLSEAESDIQIPIKDLESCLDKVDLRKLDIALGITRALEQAGLEVGDASEWEFFKYIEEPEFGPGFVHTLFIAGRLVDGAQPLQGSCKWMTKETCLDLLLKVKPCADRLGPLVVSGPLRESDQSASNDMLPTLHYQEYPPGVVLVPMKSRTGKPFRTTNLVIFSSKNDSSHKGDCDGIAQGDALIIDPGCHSSCHEELRKIINVLPRRLVVFVTHHHRDHVDGLSVVQNCNPDATLLAHENTMRRLGKGDWSLSHTSVCGGENIWVGGQKLSIIFAPGHTDGHLALLHHDTHSLIVGDHCVGQGSSILDITSGGNMTDYFETTYGFIEFSPHVLIPMHGRVNLWPKHMLCSYLKNRRSREAAVLKAIESGAETLFDIVAYVYSEVDRSFWIPAASNVRLHVDHLNEQKKLPKVFSVKKFQRSCGISFLWRWACTYLGRKFLLTPRRPGLLVSGAVAGLAVLFYSLGKSSFMSDMNKKQLA